MDDQQLDLDSPFDEADNLDLSVLTADQAQAFFDDRGEPDIELISTYFQDGLPYHEGWLMVPACAF